ncbi:putative glucan endo-1,3-beta-glucosidase eglC [Cytospora mali]|uniref:glucan endo-1,3-beta-D-glucosidase n=1 Tax=Cytospora mali TaxID=578113 RepID=A0A194VD80_CYTMA|nr:putative glucan endo-1,3-beta-glucosidase eglC [Valsa mali var. pyri (nom. inval.)]
MVCSKKATQTAAAVLTAASTIYGGQSSAVATPQADIVSKSATVSAANSGIKGFNYGAFFLDQTAKKQVDFQYEFNRAQNLANTTGWNSARLYTMVQWGTASDPITAIPAAIATKTTLLLGMWVSGSTAAIDNEIAALKSAISTYGTDFTDLVKGISVGSEDLYRAAQGDSSNPGVEVDTLISYVTKVRNAIKGTALESIPVGHVDTYDSFENATNTKIISDLDWIGFDGYPYWEKANGNSIDDASELFYRGLNKTKAIAGDKPVYVTETGWPVSGDQFGQAVASDANARKYWKDIACTLTENNINVWWYILQESQNGQASPDFGIFGAGDLATVPQSYDLSCP